MMTVDAFVPECCMTSNIVFVLAGIFLSSCLKLVTFADWCC